MPEKTEYTKGDWEARASKANRYWKAEVRTPDKMDAEGKHAVEFGQLIAVCYGKNTVANAHLIAAAPDLYEALKAFLAIEYPPDIAEWLGEAFPEAHEIAQEAIAKAESK